MGYFSFMDQYYKKPNTIAQSQRIFQAGKLPIHLKGRVDASIYKTAMYGSAVGLIFAMYCFQKMALGNMKRPKND